MDLHEAYLALKDQLRHMGFDDNIIDPDTVEEPDEEGTYWIVPSKGGD